MPICFHMQMLLKNGTTLSEKSGKNMMKSISIPFLGFKKISCTLITRTRFVILSTVHLTR